jgi:hypothetical protein
VLIPGASILKFKRKNINGATMGLSKKDIGRRKANLKTRLEELEKKAKFDPMMRDTKLHEEIAQTKKKLAEIE